LINPYGFSVWLFVLLFILMDKSDEFQLVFFIQKFKSFQAIGALIGAATASNKLFRCSLQPSIDVSPSWQAVYARLNEDEPLIPIVNGTDAVANSLLENATAMVSTIAQVAVNTAFKSENAEPCSMISPGSDPKFKFNCYAEPVRILLVWMAFFLLAIGHAKGGVGEVEALEMVRTDLADGTLDGEAALDDVSTGSGAEVLEVAPSIVTREIKKARKKCGARTGKGGVLPYFLIYDILVALYCIWNYVGLILCNGYSPTDPDTEWKFWTTIFMMQQTYAVLAFPFLVLSIPILGAGLTRTKATGYDMHGKLCSSLGAGQVRQIYTLREELKKQQQVEGNLEVLNSPNAKKKKYF
jgi:hypothetical protein